MIVRPHGADAEAGVVGSKGTIMPITERCIASAGSGDPSNKGRLVGQKRPLKPKRVRAVSVRLAINGGQRDFVVYALAIDRKLRVCDLVELKVDEIQNAGQPRGRATVIQRKTGRPVQFEMTEPTRAAVQDSRNAPRSRSGSYRYPSGLRAEQHHSTRQYARLVHGWVKSAGLDGSAHGTHSM